MGGMGSGRQGWKNRCEDFKTLDANWLRRQGYLEPGCTSSVAWWRGGEKIGNIQVRSEAHRIILAYRVKLGSEDWQDVTESVPILWTPCTHGGAHAYFKCPGVVNGRACGRRVGKLFAGGEYFLCRHCYGLAYSSQYEPPHDRLMRKADRMRRALGGDPGMDEPILRPKGMWRRTFWRRHDAILDAEEQANLAILRHVLRLSGRLGQRR